MNAASVVGPGRATDRLRIEDYLVLAAALLLPWAFGGVELWAYRSAALLLAASAACALAREGAAGLGLGRGTRWLLPAALLGVWAAFQLIPLPPGAVEWMSPEADALYRDTYPGYPQAAPDDLVGFVEGRALEQVPEAAGLALPTRVAIELPTEFAGRWSGWRPLSLLPGAGVERLCWYLALLLGFLVIQRRCIDDEVRHLYRNAFFAMFLALAVFGLIYEATSNGKLYWVRAISLRTHPFGPYVNPNNFGAAMELATPWLAGYALASLGRGRGRPWSELRTPVFAAGAVLCLVAGLASASKASAVLLLAGLTVLGFSAVRGWRARALVAGSATLVAVSAALLLAETRLGERMREFVDRTGGSYAEVDRWVGWRASLGQLGDFLWTGSGFGSFRDVFPAYMPPGELARWRQLHNDYLEVLVEGGLVAGVLLVWLIVAFGLRLGRAQFWRGHPESVGLIIGLVTLAVHGLFDFNHQIPANGLLFVALAAIASGAAGSADGGGLEPGRRRLPLALVMALLLLGGYATRAVYGLRAAGYSHGRRLAAAAKFDQALPLLERSAVGQDRAAALWLTAQVRLGIWHDRLAQGEEPESMGELMGQAYREYTEAISLSPASGWYWAALGDVYHQRERMERFRAGFPLELLDAGPWARVGRPGRLAVGMGRIAVRREPTVYTLQDQLAFQLMDYGVSGEALEVVRRSAAVQPIYRLHAYPDLDPLPPGLLDAFAEGALAALGRAPFLARVYHLLALGRLELRREDPTAAEGFLREALEVPGTRINRAEAEYYLGRALAAQGREAEALAALERAGKHPTFSADALAERAAIAESAGRFEEALGLLDEARLADRRKLRLALDFARVARRQGAWTRAEAALRWAVAVHSEDPRPLKALGMTYLEQSKFDKAREVLAQLEKLGPGSRETLQLRAALEAQPAG